MKKLTNWIKKVISGEGSKKPRPSATGGTIPPPQKTDSERPAKRKRKSGGSDAPRRQSEGESPSGEGRRSGARLETTRDGRDGRGERSGSRSGSGRRGSSGRSRRDSRSSGGEGRRRRDDDAPEAGRTASPPAGDSNLPDPDSWTAQDASEIQIPADYPFADLGIAEPFVKAVVAMGYETPTSIQAQAIPAILEGRDVVGASQTGTGKTAAFALPILSKMQTRGDKPRCLILEPTRELAAQVEEAFIQFSRFSDLRCALLHGGVGYGQQNEWLRRGVDTVLATPGRLLDHLERGSLSLENIEYLVLDEVDRMLDMGFLPDVRRIIDKCPAKRQTLFFSATMPPQIETLASFAVSDPVKFEVGRRFSPADTVAHAFYPVAADQRDDLLLALLKETDYNSVMIFTRTKAEADRVHALLGREPGHNATVMHSDIKQSDRTKALEGFRKGEFEIIVATDVAARGLDISDVTHVINYRVPENPEDYVHRIGRTGRANKEGDAFTLLSGEELEFAVSIERFIGHKVPRRKLDGFPYLYTALLDDDLPLDKKTFQRALGRTRGGGGKRKKRR